MGLLEKIAWWNLAVLALGSVFYCVLLQFSIDIITFRISFILLFSSLILGILCNIGFVIYQDRTPAEGSEASSQEMESTGKSGLIPHLLYWGAFLAILAGTWYWINVKFSVIIVMGFMLLYGYLLRMYKGKIIEPVSASAILFQREMPGYDERDLLILKRSRYHWLVAFYAATAVGLITTIIRIGSFDAATIVLFLMVIHLLCHIIKQISTILQYRLGQ